MKKRIVSLVLLLLIFSTVCVFAAPATLLPKDAVSNATGILTVTNPASSSISSYDRSHKISGYAATGAEISIYSLNNGMYNILYKDESPVSFISGASGMFISPVTLGYGKNDILMSEPVARAMKDLRKFMFERVYQNPEAKSEESKAEMLVQTLYSYYRHHIELLPEDMVALIDKGEPEEMIVCDYIGAMTDRFAIAKYEEIYIPKSWPRFI